MSGTYEYDRADAPAGALRLHLNEHTGGCSPRVLDAIRRVDAGDVARYQDYGALHRRVAERYGLDERQVLLTNGLDEGLLAASIVHLRGEQREAVVLEPAFGMYADCVDAVGGTVVRVPPRGALDFALDLPAVRAAITPRTGLLFVTSPGNPTGRSIAREDVLAMAEALPTGALLLLDEAYAEFAPATFFGPAHAGRAIGPATFPPNVVVGRTFAKAYGLAGLRVGVLFGDAATITRLRRVVPPYSLNVFVVAALEAALDDTAYVTDYVRQVAESKTLLYEACGHLGLTCVPSDANFVLVHVGDRRLEVIAGLEARNIYVRDRDSQPGCAGCIRITTGLVDHTRLCVAALEEILCARE